MAITKLMNIKSSQHGAGRHLYNAIKYIMNPEKTKDGLLVGGNAGTDAREVYQTMMDTKLDWEKMDGRQGYHFVISWKPGEIDEKTAFEVINEFCKEYLGDNYDYVFSIHDDQEHIHGHIVFNSVSRNTGYKYRYQKGDWEKKIQPITDKVCERYGVSKLQYEKDTKVGKSYAEHFAEKEGNYTWKKIIQSDIDLIISRSDSWENFLNNMKNLGYTFPRSGVRKNIGEYLTFSAPGGHKKRSDSLGPGYTVADIKARIDHKERGDRKPAKDFSPRITKYRMKFPENQKIFLSSYQWKTVRNYCQAATYFSRKNPFAVNQVLVRQNLLRIEKLSEDCRYLLRRNIRTEADLNRREAELKQEEKLLRVQISKQELFQNDETYTEYLQLNQELNSIQNPADDRFEQLQDRIEKLEEMLPSDLCQMLKENENASGRIAGIRQEKRILRHIKKSERMSDLKQVKMPEAPAKTVITKKREITKKGGSKPWKKM